MIFKKGKTNWIFLIIFIIFSLIFGGEIVYNIQTYNKEISLLEKPLDINVRKTKLNSSLDTVWHQYRNEEFGISLNYPSDWEVSLGPCSTPFWGVSEGCLRVEYSKDKKCALYIAKVDEVQYQDILSFKSQFGEKEVNIGGEKAVKIDKEDMPYLLKTSKGSFIINPMGNVSCEDDVLTIIKKIKFSQ